MQSVKGASGVRVARNPDAPASGLALVDHALARATGAPRIDGNAVRVLRDAAENFPAWLEAIAGAERTIFIEQYIFSNDAFGRQLADLLMQKARQGVVVCVLYDWLGTWHAQPLWNALTAAGVKVQCFNPFRFRAPFEWLSRDHRKQIIVDGRIGFVSGLCISSRWQGDTRRRIEPWRDTGLEIVGPAVAALERAFAQTWLAAANTPLAAHELVAPDSISRAGTTSMRVIAGVPYNAGVFRLDQVVASAAEHYLWLTDAYFVGVSPYVQALCAAAQDGVDVRLLVPGASDIPALGPLSRAGYRPLLAGGVRVFEWNGSMLHAKSAVADGLWARVGSTNLNFASWMHNWELDVAIEDPHVADMIADMYEEDLRHSTEIVLTRRNRLSVAGSGGRRTRGQSPRRPRAVTAVRAAAGAMSVGSALGAALSNRRLLGPAEAGLLFHLSWIAIVIAVIAVAWPKVLAYPVALVALWLGLVMLARAWKLLRRAQQKAAQDMEQRPAHATQVTARQPPSI
ncbi:MAG: phospholipase D-like domain-containing protein, partial [Pseudomonadota bacterium]|nr:phospholipase D-like domain-containing protein [Pseudomonadota bacterium]